MPVNIILQVYYFTTTSYMKYEECLKKKKQWKAIRRKSAQTTQITESNQAFTNIICKYEPDYRIVHND